jgi:hypothetical protein
MKTETTLWCIISNLRIKGKKTRETSTTPVKLMSITRRNSSTVCHSKGAAMAIPTEDENRSSQLQDKIEKFKINMTVITVVKANYGDEDKSPVSR